MVYDSGTLSFNGGTDLLLAALENTTGIGDNPVNLLAVSDDGATEVFDSATGFEARVVHNSADTPAVDVLVNRARALSRISFREARAYSDLAAAGGNYNVVVAASDDKDIAPIALDLDLDQSASYTVVAVGALNGVVDNTLEAVLTRDDRRDVATEARLRVIHGSYAVARDIPVDVYLSADGDISSAAPAISSLAYASATEQLPVAAGDYIVTVTAAGDRSIVAFESATPVTLDAGVNCTVIARDPADGEDPGDDLVLVSVLTD